MSEREKLYDKRSILSEELDLKKASIEDLESETEHLESEIDKINRELRL